MLVVVKEKVKKENKANCNNHMYLHRKSKKTVYLAYPPHLLLKKKTECPENQEIPNPFDLIYLGFNSRS